MMLLQRRYYIECDTFIYYLYFAGLKYLDGMYVKIKNKKSENIMENAHYKKIDFLVFSSLVHIQIYLIHSFDFILWDFLLYMNVQIINIKLFKPESILT